MLRHKWLSFTCNLEYSFNFILESGETKIISDTSSSHKQTNININITMFNLNSGVFSEVHRLERLIHGSFLSDISLLFYYDSD